MECTKTIQDSSIEVVGKMIRETEKVNNMTMEY